MNVHLLQLFAYNWEQQHPPRLSTMRTRGVTFCAGHNAWPATKQPGAYA